MTMAQKQVKVRQQLHEAMKEVQDKHDGKSPKGSAFDMIKNIRKDIQVSDLSR